MLNTKVLIVGILISFLLSKGKLSMFRSKIFFSLGILVDRQKYAEFIGLLISLKNYFSSLIG